MLNDSVSRVSINIGDLVKEFILVFKLMEAIAIIWAQRVYKALISIERRDYI